MFKNSILVFTSILSFCHLSYVDAKEFFYDRASRSTSIAVAGIVYPKTISELVLIVTHSKKPLSVAGARFSQGGQIGDAEALMIDMSGLNKVVHFERESRYITVQAGMTWSELQRYIDPRNLSVAVMQSYNDFSIGGSLSVNVHGRD